MLTAINSRPGISGVSDFLFFVLFCRRCTVCKEEVAYVRTYPCARVCVLCVHTNVHRSIIHNNRKGEATHMSTNR